MKNNKLIFLSIALFAILIALYNISTDLNYRVKIASWLSIPSKSFVEENGIKKIKIQLSENDKLHFERLYRDYHKEGLGPGNELFKNYYKKNNKWIKTTLVINEKNFNVRIKSHGRTPWAHKYGDNFSLAIKFQDNPYPFFSKRINLIIYNRIQLKSDILKLMASKFNLIHPSFELVSAKIGDKSESLFFIEERINEDFFYKRNLPRVIFNKGNYGSLFCFDSANSTKQDLQLIKELGKRTKLSADLKILIKNNYRNINNTIVKKDVDELKKNIDVDYCASLNAFRVVYGSDGHGSENGNFEMSYDTISHLFYPIAHRDFISTTLANCQSPYTFMDSTKYIIPFWLILDKDTDFLKITNQKIDEFLLKNNVTSLSSEFNELINYYKPSHIFEYSYMNNGMNGNSILKNVECLSNSKSTK